MQNYVKAGREEDQRPPSRVLVLGQRDVDCQQTDMEAPVSMGHADRRHPVVGLSEQASYCGLNL